MERLLLMAVGYVGLIVVAGIVIAALNEMDYQRRMKWRRGAFKRALRITRRLNVRRSTC